MDIDIAASRPAQPASPLPKEAVDVGTRIAQLRAGRGWTLQQTARHTGVAFSTLSKIERHELSPTVTTLAKIAHGMELTLAQRLESPRPPSGTARRSLSRAGESRSMDTGACDNAVLCSDLKNRRMTPIRTRVRARDLSVYEEWASYDAEIFLTVLQGTLIIHSQSYEPTRLEAGDSTLLRGVDGAPVDVGRRRGCPGALGLREVGPDSRGVSASRTSGRPQRGPPAVGSQSLFVRSGTIWKMSPTRP